MNSVSKASRFNNVVFLMLLAIVFLLGGSVYVKGQILVSGVENRNLATFGHFTLRDFWRGDFQSNFESALSDQFLFSGLIRANYAQVISSLPDFGLKENLCKNHYIELSSNDRKRGTFDCGDYIMYMPEPLVGEKREVVKANLQKYKQVNEKTKAYFYFVDDSSSFDFETGQRVNDYYEMMRAELGAGARIGRLEYDNYDGYRNYFYKTDHHWNYKGSYQGYLDIADMMGIKNVSEPVGISTNHEAFFGSHARTTNTYDYAEEFEFYDFEIPAHKTLINGVPGKYNHFDEYKRHEYQYDKTTNYYAYVYGDDYAEVIFDFGRPEKDNLLIVANSYSNAIDELIAQHFNKTYIVDLRWYRKEYDRDFRLSDYIEKNNIDKVLLIMSPTLIWDEISNEGLEL